ncbi:hypothetical protein [uncultured Hyphomicrobium sp.]|uniref:hypothetical protein n=1 Tax=uncultured Hyphomicrobium sp. TaxID=194373 RepID=UPI0025D88138|nr:hypothetical protein [uncultured Hyphomicrobium sp.]
MDDTKNAPPGASDLRRDIAEQELDGIDTEHDLYLARDPEESLSSFAKRMVEALADKITDLEDTIERIEAMDLDDEEDVA